MKIFLSGTPWPVIIIIAGFVIAIILTQVFSAKNVILRTLKRLPSRSINGVKSNEFVKIHGKALHANEPLLAPLSRRKCVFYSIKIEQKKGSGKNSHWKTLVQEERYQDFFVEKNGELLLIKPTKNPLNYINYLVTDKETDSGTFNDPTPEFERLLSQYGISSTGLFGFNKSLRYTEGIISVGERITVAGKVFWKTLNEPIPEYPYSKIAQLEADGKQKIIITDLPEAQKTTI
ncbi:hypothetical protein [Mangrovimonas sp. ST2L15]|uniref:hypothetical protein n=1 Tax=Mangrovimonas sp. ST2L15 TaxID=1645916 RepID=UPI0006B65E01|nr:hypothetical protein [Mangrovimonas sp. ST2L15]